jgi:hypothetical protein
MIPTTPVTMAPIVETTIAPPSVPIAPVGLPTERKPIVQPTNTPSSSTPVMEPVITLPTPTIEKKGDTLFSGSKKMME